MEAENIIVSQNVKRTLRAWSQIRISWVWNWFQFKVNFILFYTQFCLFLKKSENVIFNFLFLLERKSSV